MKKYLAIIALFLASASPAFAAPFWVVGKPYALYYDANAKYGSQTFGRLVEANETAGYVIFDNNSTRGAYTPQDVLLDGSIPSPYHFPPTIRMWWSLKDVVYVAPITKLPN